MKKLVKITDEAISRAAEIIRSGKLVVFPTETVYGLGANAFDPEAVIRIFEAKERPKFDPLIVHIADESQLNDICMDINDTAKKLIKNFWPGPLTIIFKKKKIIPDIVTSGLPTVAIRMPSHAVARELIKKAGCAIAAPSANKFSYITPTTAKTVFEQISDKVDMILDDGRSDIGIESTIISVIEEPVILRPGGLEIEKIEKVIGKIKSGKSKGKIEAPGQMKKHYAPDTKMEFFTSGTVLPENKKLGLITFKNLPENKERLESFESIEILSPKGNLHEAARSLFSVLYKLDKMKLDKIYVEKVPEKGIGIAIMDRLKKAVS